MTKLFSLYALIKRNKRASFNLVLFFSLLGASLEGFGLLLILPLTSPKESWFSPFSKLLPENELSLNTIVLIYLGILSLIALVRYLKLVFTAKLALTTVENTKSDLVNLAFNANFHAERENVGKIFHTISRETDSLETSVYHFMQLISSTVICIVYFLISFYVSPKVTIFTCFSGALLLFFLKGKLAQTSLTSEKRFKVNEKAFSTLNDYFNSQKFVILNNLAIPATEKLRFSFKEQANLGLQISKSAASRDSLFFALSGVILSLAALLFLPKDPSLKGATLAVIVIAFARIVPKLQAIQGLLQSLRELYPPVERYIHFIDSLKLKAKKLAPVKIRTSIELENISFSYPSQDSPLLDNITLSLNKASVTGLTGPSGSGKTTLADIISGYQKPNNGALLLDGEDLPNYRIENLCYLSQSNFTTTDTILENLNLLRRTKLAKDDEILLGLLKDFGLSNLIQKLNKKTTDASLCLSGGEKQRLSIIRAVLASPDFLIMDEATSELDEQMESIVISKIKELLPEAIVLIISHRKNTLVKHCDTVKTIQSGKIFTLNPQAELRSVA